MKRILVGRSNADCDVVISEPSVSALHLELRVGEDGTCTVIDSKSTNGTFVLKDGERQRVKRARLSLDEPLWLGSYQTSPRELSDDSSGVTRALGEATGAPIQSNEKGRGNLEYDAFISYSRKDTDFAAQLEKKLERYRLPKLPGLNKRHFNAFRDAQDLVGADYFDSIDAAIRESKKLILICTPNSAQSDFVGDEVRRFSDAHGSQHIIPILLDGIPNNEAGPGDEDAQAFPPALMEAVEMPLAIQFDQFDPQCDQLDRGEFKDGWHTILASLLDLTRAEVEQRELKRRQRVVRAVIAALGALVIVLSGLTGYALYQRGVARAQEEIALATATDLDEKILELLKIINVDQIIGKEGVPGTVAFQEEDGWVQLLQNRTVSDGARNWINLLAARDYDRGRVIVAAHDGVLNFCNPLDRDCDEFSDRALQVFFLELVTGWLAFTDHASTITDREPNVAPNEESSIGATIRVALTSGHCEIIPDAYREVGDFLEGLFTNLDGYSVKILEAPLSPRSLSATDVLIVGNAWGNFSDGEVEAVHEFVAGGGGLLATGLGWSWRRYLNDDNFGRVFCADHDRIQGQDIRNMSTYPMNVLVAPYGVEFTHRASQ